MKKKHLPFKNKPNCSRWLQVITIPPCDSWTLQVGIFHGEKRDHYSWVTGKAQLQEPGEHWSFDEGDSLLFWRLAEQCWCLEWKSAIKQLSAVPHTCPAWKCSAKAAFQGQFLPEQPGSVLDEGRAPWCSCTPRFWFQAQQGCSQPALLPFLPPLSCWSWVDLFLLLVGGFEKWNSTGGGIATGNPFIIISWCKKTVFKLNIFFKNKASGGALIPVFGIIFNFNKTSQQLFIKFFSWRNLFSVYIQKTEFATIGQMWYLGKKKKAGTGSACPQKSVCRGQRALVAVRNALTSYRKGKEQSTGRSEADLGSIFWSFCFHISESQLQLMNVPYRMQLSLKPHGSFAHGSWYGKMLIHSARRSKMEIPFLPLRLVKKKNLG